jgi:hypothetical protein
MKKPLIAACAAALLAGCAILEQFKPPTAEPPGPVNAYEQGWRDGCATGLYVRSVRFTGAPLAGDRYVIDTERFRTNKDYTIGWGDGIRSCDTGRPERR